MSIEKYLKTQLMPNGQIAGALDLPTLLVDFVALFKMVQDIHQRLETGVVVEDSTTTPTMFSVRATACKPASEPAPEPESKLILT